MSVPVPVPVRQRRGGRTGSRCRYRSDHSCARSGRKRVSSPTSARRWRRRRERPSTAVNWTDLRTPLADVAPSTSPIIIIIDKKFIQNSWLRGTVVHTKKHSGTAVPEYIRRNFRHVFQGSELKFRFNVKGCLCLHLPDLQACIDSWRIRQT